MKPVEKIYTVMPLWRVLLEPVPVICVTFQVIFIVIACFWPKGAKVETVIVGIIWLVDFVVSVKMIHEWWRDDVPLLRTPLRVYHRE